MTEATSGPRVLSRAEHPISRQKIAPIALKVLYRLKSCDKLGYMCGGAVRDLMLEREPKDYDVATDARPQEMRRLFRNSRIIGRRFRLAHVYFKEGIVEVSTFRRDPDPEAQDSAEGELLITDDNVYGTPEEDANRRDFTINALFYNIADYSVIDYVGGIEDLEAKQLRVIGDPDVRFQEDPIRMTRACELAGRLGFTIEGRTQESIHRNRREIEKASTARLTEELLQILRCGDAGRALQWMVELGLAEVMLPEVEAIHRAEKAGLGPYSRLLPVVDRKAAAGEELPEIPLLAAVLIPAVALRRQEVRAEHGGALPKGRLAGLVEETIAPFFARFTLSKLKAERVTQVMVDLAMMRRGGWDEKRRARFARRAGFGDALFLYELLVAAGAPGGDELDAWRDMAPRRKSSRPAKRPRRGRRRRRRGKPRKG